MPTALRGHGGPLPCPRKAVGMAPGGEPGRLTVPNRGRVNHTLPPSIYPKEDLPSGNFSTQRTQAPVLPTEAHDPYPPSETKKSAPALSLAAVAAGVRDGDESGGKRQPPPQRSPRAGPKL